MKLVKAAALPIGSVRTWGEKKHQKISTSKWAPISEVKGARGRGDTKAARLFDEATTMSWAGLGITEHLEKKYKVSNFADLKKIIKQGSGDQASKVFRSAKDYVDGLSIPTGNKQAAIDRLGRSLLTLRDLYARVKTKLTMPVRSRTGKLRYEPKKAPQASFKASRIKAAQDKLGGWSDMSKYPTTSQLRKMVSNGTAKITFGEPVGGKKWETYQGMNDVVIPFKEKEKGITVKMRQMRKLKQRTLRTATIEMQIPYPYARQFLENKIESLRTRNNLIGQLSRSAGYKKAAA